MKPMMAGTIALPMTDITRREEPTLMHAPRFFDAERKNRGKHHGMKETKQDATAPRQAAMRFMTADLEGWALFATIAESGEAHTVFTIANTIYRSSQNV